MKRSCLLCLVIPLLFSCAPKKPEIPMLEVAPDPLVHALEQRARSFSSLKALASLQVRRKGQKRSFDSTGILVNDQEQFRVEAYGQLGESLIRLVWNGKELLLDMNGQRRVMARGGSGLERILGTDIDPAELCAVLSGNIPGILAGPRARMRCAEDGACILEVERERTMVRAHTPPGGNPEDPAIPSYEVFRGGRLVYQVRLESYRPVSGYELPAQILVENPARHVSLVIEYIDADVNAPLDERAFSIEDTDR